ncbi:MAG: twin-arginine translocation signal domain-containing protein [Xanthobacteraceae bacterium]
MKADNKVARRDFLRALGAGAGTVATASGSFAPEAVAAEDESDEEKRKARYQANSPEVQDFYRVNRYPSK